MLRQLLYASLAATPMPRTIDVIFEQSRHNNALDGITGLLYSDGYRFLQVLEGPPESVRATWGRIRRDPRHRDVAVIHDVERDGRAFGSWSMASRDRRTPADMFDERLRRILIDAPTPVRDQFMDLVTERLAA